MTTAANFLWPRWTGAERQRAVELSKSGLSHREVASRLGRSYKAVRQMFSDLGHRPRVRKTEAVRRLIELGYRCRAVVEALGVDQRTYYRALRRLAATA